MGIESTVINVSSDNIRILRPGAITQTIVESIVGRPIGRKYIEEGVPEAPGMKYRHYAPAVPVEVLTREEIIVRYDELAAKRVNPVILTLGNSAFYGDRELINLGLSTNDAARALFKALREGEKSYSYILSEDFSDDGGIGSSVMNRLNKAAKK